MIFIFISGLWKTTSSPQAQITVAIGIPLIYLWFAGIPPGSEAATFGVLSHAWREKQTHYGEGHHNDIKICITQSKEA